MILAGAASRVELMDAIANLLRAGLDVAPFMEIGRTVASRLTALPREEGVEPPADVIASLAAPVGGLDATRDLNLRTARRAAQLLLDAVAYDAAEALERTLRATVSDADGAAMLVRLARFLDMTGLGRDLPASAMERFARALAQLGLSDIPRLLAGLEFLGLSKAAPPEARREAFFGLAIPRLRAAVEARRLDAALSIEASAYEAYVKAIESPGHHREAFAAIETAYDSLGDAPMPSPPAPRPRPKVAFLIPNGAMLAHTEVLLSFLSGLGVDHQRPLEPIVVIFRSPHGGELGKRLDQLAVPWIALGMTGPFAHEDNYSRLRDTLAAQAVDAAVVVSLPMHLAYFCRRPLAPIQIWWSMKFALPNFARLDGRVFYRSLFDAKLMVDGQLWRGGPLAFDPPPSPDPAAVAAIRARFPGMRLLGTIAREEKIANLEYLGAVIEILRRHPDACFLWTGRMPLPEVERAFAAAKVADRCHFLGWVDPLPYLGAFDLFLETYPLTGLMTGWAMALGRPVVSVGPLGFLGAYLGPLFSGELPASATDRARLEAIFAPVGGRLPRIWAGHPRDMPDFADALLGDPVLSRTFGECLEKYVRTFMGDLAASAAAQARHFADIVRERRLVA